VSQKPPLQEFAQSNPRISGIFVLLVGVVFLYFSVAEPVLHAELGSQVRISGKGAIGGGMFAILGLVLILFGARALGSLQSAGSGSKTPIYIVGGLFAVLGIVAMESLKAYLRSKGYIV
jgi:hypothetical protein